MGNTKDLVTDEVARIPLRAFNLMVGAVFTLTDSAPNAVFADEDERHINELLVVTKTNRDHDAEDVNLNYRTLVGIETLPSGEPAIGRLDQHDSVYRGQLSLDFNDVVDLVGLTANPGDLDDYDVGNDTLDIKPADANRVKV